MFILWLLVRIMQKLTIIKSIITPLRLDNIDTDMIIPKQFLKTIKRTGLGKYLFHEMRCSEDGNLNKDFILNKEKYQKSQILIAGKNFGCGSSREHAPWALSDFGFRVIIATSYADIFYSNCFKNSILPITLPQNLIDIIWDSIATSPDLEAEINLEKQHILIDNQEIKFDIAQSLKDTLINGLDDIAKTLKNSEMIANFEFKQENNEPWLYENSSKTD